MEKESYYGKGGRLSKDANPKLVATAYTHDCDDGKVLMPGLHIADLAHAIMLYKAEILPSEPGKRLLNALVEITNKQIEMNPTLGDVYNSKEFALKQMIGKDAGWLHLGRARREAVNNGFLFEFKSCFLHFYQTVITLSEKLCGISREHLGSIMSDFTYMLHAQPTSLGHYLATYLTPLLRDCERMHQYFMRLDQSWAGIGSVNGSRLPLDRLELAKLMGFKKIAPHLRDAMWMPDIMNEGIFILTNIFAGLNRLVEELIVWNTQEFAFIEIDDSYARASVIMPQKKNPYPLAYLRGLCSNIMGKLMSYLSLGKISSGFPDSRIFIYGDIIRIYQKSNMALDMFSDFLVTIKWNTTKMRNIVEESVAYSTDLAETISINYDLDYKTSHKIVGKAVRELENSENILSEILNSLRKRNLTINDEIIEQLKNSINYERLVLARNGIGASSPDSMKDLLKNVENELLEHKKNVAQYLLFRQDAIDYINIELKSILKNEFQEFKFT